MPPARPDLAVCLLKALLAGALLLGLAGCALAVVRAVRGPGGQRWAIVAVFVLVYFVFISVRPVVGPRYLLPLLPAIALLVAGGLLFELFRGRGGIGERSSA